MTARRLMVVLAGSFMLVPLALAQDHAASRGGGGGGSSQASSRDSGSGGGGSVQTSGSSFSTPAYDPGPRSSAQPAAMARDHAVSRGGGGSHSRGGSSSSSGTASKGGSSSSSGSSAKARGESSSSTSRHPQPSSAAERRHPRAGTGARSHGGYSGDGRYYPYPYSHGYGSYYSGWGWGSYWWPYGSYYDGWYGGGYWGYPYGGWAATRSYMHRDIGSVRVLVDPAEARVYVDGYYAGTVDDFDGLFQRLSVSPGRHEITLKLEGYKTHRVKVYVPFESTLKLHYDMEKGSGETFEDQAVNIPASELARERAREHKLRELRESALRESEQEEGEGDESLQQDESDEARGPATLRLNVTPPDASVYVDGAFRGTAREVATIQLAPGRHKLEVVRPGYRTVEREVEVAADDPGDVTIELEKTSI